MLTALHTHKRKSLIVLFVVYCSRRTTRQQQLDLSTDDENSDSEQTADHDYDMPVIRGKKFINKGRWTKEEVSGIFVNIIPGLKNRGSH